MGHRHPTLQAAHLICSLLLAVALRQLAPGVPARLERAERAHKQLLCNKEHFWDVFGMERRGVAGKASCCAHSSAVRRHERAWELSSHSYSGLFSIKGKNFSLFSSKGRNLLFLKAGATLSQLRASWGSHGDIFPLPQGSHCNLQCTGKKQGAWGKVLAELSSFGAWCLHPVLGHTSRFGAQMSHFGAQASHFGAQTSHLGTQAPHLGGTGAPFGGTCPVLGQRCPV